MALPALVAACYGTRPVVPRGEFAPVPLEALADLAARTAPHGRELLRIRWQTEDSRARVSGSGAVRIASPDTLRIDVAVRLGVGRATLIVAGDSAWADPEDLVRQLLPERFALWAALGVVRPPDGAGATERLVDGSRTFWRVVHGDDQRTTFEMRGDTLASVTRERGGARVAQLQLTRGSDGAVTRAQVTDFEHQARFVMDIVSRQSSEAFPSEVWRLRS